MCFVGNAYAGDRLLALGRAIGVEEGLHVKGERLHTVEGVYVQGKGACAGGKGAHARVKGRVRRASGSRRACALRDSVLDSWDLLLRNRGSNCWGALRLRLELLAALEKGV